MSTLADPKSASNSQEWPYLREPSPHGLVYGAYQAAPPQPTTWGPRLYWFSQSGKVAECASDRPWITSARGGKRGTVTGFTDASRRRLVRGIASREWSKVERLDAVRLFITLTYHGCPSDGRETKAHLKAFRKRWERRFGKAVGPWKREYQRRGSAHFHLVVYAPGDTHISYYRRWVAKAWNEVSGQSGDPAALSAGTQVDVWRRGDRLGYFAGYGVKKREKRYQDESPVSVSHGGRWWGIWGLRSAWSHRLVTRKQWCSLRRSLRKARLAKGARCAKLSASPHKIWVIGASEGWSQALAEPSP